MTLLEDLGSLNLDEVLAARADISVTVNGADLLALAGGGAVGSVLGEVGTAIQAAVDGFADPAALVEPLAAALSGVLAGIDADLPVGDYVDGVAAAARIVAGLVGMISGDPNRIGFGGLDAGTALTQASGLFGDHAAVVSGNLARFRALVQTVEGGLPTDAGALLAPALEILLPFPTGSIDAVRQWAGRLTVRLDEVAIDPALTSGLVAALGRVRVAADAGDAAALTAALAALADVRAATVTRLAEALRRIAGVVSGIRLDDALAVLGDLRGVLANADENVFELLDGWRATIASVRTMIASLDATAAMQYFEGVLDDVEDAARDVLLAGVDASVEVVKQWLRDLLREVPIRALRLQLSQAIADAAHAVGDADLDAPVEAVRGLLTTVSRVLTEADPAALVQQAVTELEGVVRGALDSLEQSLGRVTAGINAVAGQAEQVLGRAVEGLGTFRTAIDGITAAIEGAGILDAADEIRGTLGELRETVSDLLSNAPVPDALRETVGQLVGTLESIDLDAAIGAPLREVAARLQIPPEVATTVRDGLAAVAEAARALVPHNVIADLESLMQGLLDEIGNLDISSLTGGITELLDGAAAVFDGVRMAELVAPAAEVFAEIVAAVDRAHPRVLLRPAIDLYGQILGSIPVPEPAALATRVGSLTAQAGEAAARAAAEPARRAVGSAATMPHAGGAPHGGLGPAREEPPADLRPGDIVRLVGFLPAKLREALAAAGAGPAGEVLAAVGGMFTGAATDLRAVRDRVVELDAAARRALDAALAPVAAAQVDAQLALAGSAALAADGFRVGVSFDLLASAGPAALEADLGGERRLIAERSRAATDGLAGTLAADLDHVADALDAFWPPGLLTDLDAFLAALDPEPIAAEFDALLASVLDATPAFLTAAEAELRALEARVRRLLTEFNPGALMQRYLGVLDVVREELALLDPGRLADELGAVHAEVKAALLAYDPLVVAGEIDALLAQVAAAIRGLDPAGLMPDLRGIAAQVARVGDIIPVNALAGVGGQLTSVGEELARLDVQGMLDAVNALTPDIAEAIAALIDAVRDEIVALLKSIRYAETSASASASVRVG